MRHLLFLPMLLALSATGSGGSAEPQKPPIVVELFTSQGCSSCPPADRLLSKLGKDPRVIPLAFHVDYWNYIGWSDPFSSKAWSQRQQGYARAFHSNRIYTPQLVVSGRTQVVGSDESGVRRSISQALEAEPVGQVTVSAAVSPDGPDGRLKITARAKLVRAAGGPLDLWVAVYETGLSTKVGAGENASRTLANDFVVRRLEKALTLPGSTDSAELVLGLDKRWNRENLGVAAFLQDPKTLAIQGAAVAR
jgi:hypothetical protein